MGPLLVPVLFSIFANSDASANPRTTAQSLTIVNSAADPADRCTADINKSVVALLNLMGYDQWQRECERASRLAKDPQLKGNVATPEGLK